MSDQRIATKAKLIEALAGSVDERSWAADVLDTVKRIRTACDEIEHEARRRLPGER